MNNVVLIGRLTRDPEVRYTKAGQAVANFVLAVDKQLPKDKRQEMEAKNQPTADFIKITVWGAMAESSGNYLSKGSQVAIQGRIQTGYFETEEGDKRSTFEVVAQSVEFLSTNNKSKEESNPVEEAGFIPVEDDDLPF